MSAGEYRISVASPDGAGDLMWNGEAENTQDALIRLLADLGVEVKQP